MATADDPASGKKPLAPYVSFKTFLGFIRKIKESVVPEKIDADVLRQYPGSTARQLKAALRFLGLMDEGDFPTMDLGVLAEAMDTNEWSVALQKLLVNAYSPIVGDLPIERTTRVQVEARFREYASTEKVVLEKIVSFYVAALVSAGVKVSPLILERAKARANGGKPRPARRGRPADHDDDDRDDDGADQKAGVVPTTGDTMRFTIPLPDHPAVTLTLPKGLTIDQWDVLDQMMRVYLRKTTEKRSA